MPKRTFKTLEEQLNQFYAPQGGYAKFIEIWNEGGTVNERVKKIEGQFEVTRDTVFRWLRKDRVSS